MGASRGAHWRNNVTGLKARLRAKLRFSTPEFRAAGWAFAFSSLAATCAYIANTLENMRDTKLKFVNQQIEKLYGPMYALTQADNAAWVEFCEKIVPRCSNKNAGYYFPNGYAPTERDIRLWRLWMNTVFQPFNLKMEAIIMANGQLAVGLEFPEPFWRLVAHTEGYKSIMSEWKDSDIQNPASRTSSSNVVEGLNYPVEIINCVKDSYRALSETRDALETTVFYALIASTDTPKSCL
jgi:hypothetical protein